jgi:hypothetical protein
VPRGDAFPDFTSLRATLLATSYGVICLSSPIAKNIFIFIRPKSPAYERRPVPNEGRIMIVILRGTGCGGRGSVVARFYAWTSDTEAYGEVVWS